MTNEEVRNQSGYDFDFNTIVLNDLQNLARSDERTRLIQEIEEWSKKIFEIDVAWKEKLNAKLNSLKQ